VVETLKVGQMGLWGKVLNLFVQFPTDFEVMPIEDMDWSKAGFVRVDFFDPETAGGS
jgi:hypothetical protein